MPDILLTEAEFAEDRIKDLEAQVKAREHEVEVWRMAYLRLVGDMEQLLRTCGRKMEVGG